VPDLRLTDAALTPLRTGLTSAADALTGSRGRTVSLAAAALGAPRLIARMDAVADDWGHGIGLLAESLGTAAADLTVVETRLREVDETLAVLHG